MQLYTEGPFDKVITFIGVDKYRSEVTIPHSFDDIADVAFLSGHSFNELIKSEQMATEYAVTRSGHMNKTITLPVANPFTIRELLYFFEIQTAYAGELLNINAFDQPGVEEGKNATYALLGKHGYDVEPFNARFSRIRSKITIVALMEYPTMVSRQAMAVEPTDHFARAGGEISYGKKRHCAVYCADNALHVRLHGRAGR